MQGNEPMTTPTPAPARWLRGTLFVSLAVNLLVAGLVAGAVWRGGGRPMAMHDPGFGPFEAALDQTDRAALRRAFLARSGELGSPRREMRARMEAFLAALRAEPFDRAALAQAMEAAAAHTEARLHLGQTLMVDHLAALPADGRAAFADRLEAALRHGRGKPADR